MTSERLDQRLPAARADRVPRGILYMLGATVMYAGSTALSKWQVAPPAAVGPFYYFSLVWAIGLGFVFWGDIPTPALLAGSAIVVGSGLFLLWHETGKRPLTPE